MPFPYKKILVIGATSGIGEDLAARILKEAPESKVIAVGRRQEKLDDFVKKHGAERSTGVKFDITDLDEIPAFAERNTNEHKDLDMIILNSGIQRGLDFANPESIDLSSIDLEMRTNYFSYIHLLKAFLPVLQAKKEQTALVFMTSGLALAPLSRCGNYCATKAALHSLIMSLRFQLEQSGKGDIKVIEILPPAVQTELHDAKHQPDISNGGSIGMPLNEFTDEAWAGLTEGKDEIPVGMTKMGFEKLEPIRKMVFEKMNSQFKH